MKNRINKYFFHEFIRYFAVVLFASVSIIWTIQAVNFLDLVTEDGHAFRIYIVYSLLTITKVATKLITVAIEGDSPYYSNKRLYEIAKLNEFNVETAETIAHGINKILKKESPGRILICGSFYMYKEVSKLIKK